jgi:hypothetical protein
MSKTSMIKIRVNQIATSLINSVLLLTLSGCATYKSSFNCGDAKGAYCASMDRVDQMINSGEIERFNEQWLSRKYKAAKNNNAVNLKEKTKPVEITNYETDDASN